MLSCGSFGATVALPQITSAEDYAQLQASTGLTIIEVYSEYYGTCKALEHTVGKLLTKYEDNENTKVCAQATHFPAALSGGHVTHMPLRAE